MKRSFILIFSFISITLLLTGCVSQKTRKTILSKLEDAGVIKEDWDHIASDVTSAAPIPDINSYHYYYQDDSGNIYMVTISGHSTDVDKKTEYYDIYILDHMEAREKTETYTDPQTRETSEKVTTNYYKTEESIINDYKIYKRRFLLWNFWELEKEEE